MSFDKADKVDLADADGFMMIGSDAGLTDCQNSSVYYIKDVRRRNTSRLGFGKIIALLLNHLVLLSMNQGIAWRISSQKYFW